MFLRTVRDLVLTAKLCLEAVLTMVMLFVVLVWLIIGAAMLLAVFV